jgi:hypothetical protein
MQGQEEHYIKEKVKERYGKIALTGNSDCCCVPVECCDGSSDNNSSGSALESTKLIGYDSKDIDSIPKTSILGILLSRLALPVFIGISGSAIANAKLANPI